MTLSRWQLWPNEDHNEDDTQGEGESFTSWLSSLISTEEKEEETDQPLDSLGFPEIGWWTELQLPQNTPFIVDRIATSIAEKSITLFQNGTVYERASTLLMIGAGSAIAGPIGGLTGALTNYLDKKYFEKQLASKTALSSFGAYTAATALFGNLGLAAAAPIVAGPTIAYYAGESLAKGALYLATKATEWVQQDTAPNRLSSLLSVGVGSAIAGPVGGLAGAALSNLDQQYLADYKHVVSRSTFWSLTTGTAATALFGNPLIAIAAAIIAGPVIAYNTSDFLKEDRLKKLAKDLSPAWEVYRNQHPAEIEEIKNDPSKILAHIENNSVPKNLAEFVLLTFAKAATNVMFLYLLAEYGKGDISSTFLTKMFRKSAEETPSTLDLSLEASKILTILGIQTIANKIFSIVETKIRSDLSSAIEVESVAMLGNSDNTGKILASENGAEALRSAPGAILSRTYAVTTAADLFNEKVNGVLALYAIFGEASILILLQSLLGTAKKNLEESITTQQNNSQAELDTFSNSSWSTKYALSSNASILHTGNLSKFVTDTRIMLIREEEDLKTRHAQIKYPNEIKRVMLDHSDTIAHFIGWILSALYSGLPLSHVPSIKARLSEFESLLSSASLTINYGNEELVIETMAALTTEIHSPLAQSEDNHIHFRNFKLSINGIARILINDTDIAQGQHIAVKGASGLGKSTFINSLCGYIPHGVTVEGIVEIPSLENLPVLVNQKTPFIQGVTLLKNLLGNRAYEVSLEETAIIKTKAINLLDRMLFNYTGDISELLDDKDFKVSGGQEKKLGLVRAILQKPKLLFLDETFTGMDRLSIEACCRVLCEELPEAIVFVPDHDAEDNKAGFYHNVLDLNEQPAKFLYPQPEPMKENEKTYSITYCQNVLISSMLTIHNTIFYFKELSTNAGSFKITVQDSNMVFIADNTPAAELKLGKDAVVRLNQNDSFSSIGTEHGCHIKAEIDGDILLLGAEAIGG